MNHHRSAPSSPRAQTPLTNVMKRFGLLTVGLAALLVVQPVTGVYAQAVDSPAQLSVTQAAGSVDVTVFGDGFAQVEETRQVNLTAGKNRIQLNGVAAKYRQDSLRIIDVTGKGDFKYQSATYQGATLTPERILELSVGQKVKATVGSGALAKQVTGTLNHVRGGQAIIVADDGTVHLTGTSEIELPKLPAGLSATASLVIEAEVSVAGTYNLHFVYETDGLSWSAKHSLVYDENVRKVESFETTVNVVNQSGATFENANLWLLSGAVQTRGGRLQAASYARDAMAESAAPGAAVESVGERKVYRIPGRVSLGDGQSRQIPLFTGKNVPVEHEYYVPAYTYSYGETNNSLVPVSVRLKLKNCLEHNLGTPLPAGTVKVYQRNSEAKLQLTATAPLKELARDEAFDLNIGNSSDVKAERTLAKTTPFAPAVQPRVQPGQQAPEWEDQEYTVKIHNFKDKKAVDVLVEVAVPAEQQNIAPLVRKNANMATGTVHVDAGKNATLTYTLRIRTR